MNTFDFDLDLFLQTLTKSGATITEGSGKLFVDGIETDVVSALKQGFHDNDIYRDHYNIVTKSYSNNQELQENWNTPQLMIAA